MEKSIFDFIESLRTLCNEYGVELMGCECGGLLINDVPKPIEEFEIKLDDTEMNIHILPVYAKLAKMA